MNGSPSVDQPGTPVVTGKTRIPGELGIWFFVAGDLIVFSVFFILIALGNREQTEVFAKSRASLDLWIGVVNTLLLLTGSWFVAKGIEKCRNSGHSGAQHYFSLAILCGLCFIANKFFEWGSKISAGLSPASNHFDMYFFCLHGHPPAACDRRPGDASAYSLSEQTQPAHKK